MKLNWEHVAFNHEIGRALTQWSYIESQLINVVSRCIRDQDPYVIALGFLSIENFRSKLQYCDNIIRHKFAKSQHLARWESIRLRLVALSAKRNRLVHSVTILYLENTPGRRFALVPWIDSDLHPNNAGPPTVWKKGGKAAPPSGSLCLRDIVGLTSDFHALTRSLANLAMLLDGGRALLPESSERSVPPTLRAIEDRIRAELALPLKPSRKKS